MATKPAADGTPDPASYVPLDAKGTVTNAIATTSIKIRFDRFLLPTNTFRQSVCVQSDLRPVKSLKDCTANRVFFEPSYDPVRRELTLRQSATTAPQMMAGATYRVSIYPPDENGANGISAFDGAPLAAPAAFTFTTVSPTPAGAVFDQLPTGDLYCKLPWTGCAFGGCHLDQAAQGGLGAAEGLDLSTRALIKLTAVGKVAHQTQEGQEATLEDKSPLRFGRAMPIIDPGFPGNSYLMYKLLASEGNNAVLSSPASKAEVARLRESVVVGMPMPPSNVPTSLFMDEEHFEAMSNWILQGAPFPACP